MTSPKATSVGLAAGKQPEYDADDFACCALKQPHDGCCAYACSMCKGAGRTDCRYDDLGCDCGFCDGYGYCTDCGGHGWFNEEHEPCFVSPSEVARD